jgi:hypothetical protein
MQNYSLSPDAYNAYVLKGVMEATVPPGETAAEAETRSAAIVEMFRTFEAADAMESAIACHCITLRFMLNAAMRDAGNVTLEPALVNRNRSIATAISKNLHLWISKYETIHARNESRAAEASQREAPPPPRAETAKPEPVSEPRLVAARPSDRALPLVPPVSPFQWLRDKPVPSRIKEALLASAAVIPSNRSPVSSPGP